MMANRNIWCLWLFITLPLQAADTWYVRPADGDYGAANGETYETAWDGLASIVWGEGGVVAGDTLYICGTHQYGTDWIWSNVYLPVGNASGSEGSPITIRGDYESDAGVIIAAEKAVVADFTDLGGGVYRAACANASSTEDAWQGDPTGTPQQLKLMPNSSWVAEVDGSFYPDGTNHYLYVNPYDASGIEDVYYHWLQALAFCGNDYIVVDGLRMFGGSSPDGMMRLTASDTHGEATHITIRNCELAFSLWSIITAAYTTSDILIEDCVIHDTPTGTYPAYTASNYQHSNWTMRRLEVYSGQDTRNCYTNWDSLVNATYEWQLSSHGTNEYYCQLSGGGNPSISWITYVSTDGTSAYATKGVVGSLSAGEYAFGNNDSLGFNTIYVRLSDGADPDSKADGFVTMGRAAGDRHALGGQNLRNWLVEYCYIHDWAGDGIQVYTSKSGYCDNVTIRYNRIDNLNDDDGLHMHMGISRQGSDGDNSAVRFADWNVYGNVISGCHTGNGVDGVGGDERGYGAAIRMAGPGDGSDSEAKIYNNTFYDCQIGLWWGQGTINPGIAFCYRNNICLSPKSGGYHVYIRPVTGDKLVTMSNNCWYPDTDGSDNQFMWDGTTRDDWADFKADALNEDSVVIEGDSFVDDPLLTSAALGDCSLTALSPCIDSGIDLGVLYDDILDPTSTWPDAVATLDQDLHGSGWEIGACVYPDRNDTPSRLYLITRRKDGS
jgi:hypothetical protein